MSHYEYLDKSVVRTRLLLHAAILDLIDDRPYASVSVTDITKKAGVNRVTFYSYYSSKAELMEEIIEEKFNEYFSIVECIEPLKDIDQLMAGLEIYFRKSLHHISLNVKFYRILLSGALLEYKDQFEKRLHVCLKQILRKAEINGGKKSPVDLDFYIEWTIGGTIHIIHKWLASGMSTSQEQFMKQMLLISAVSSKLFGTSGDAFVT
ncbi:TetR/AcrR family transcriptional regulator [Cohnella abietis]|uniref:Putative transcriptional regulator (TetR/AcrR family) n=1 Tax=Cohnella abietis TaxID=2507935 RepID=A0A3T1DCP4_9BACL|nr:TetR/AcrR family transcriptional regulator [Cohnella abietis]BBI35867.1 putative transcriptional regulator (TetR/AcrR family) [Cohnella abietis]